MNQKKQYILLLACVLSSLITFSQSYFTNGDAQIIGRSCYQITPSQTSKLGSIWYADQLDISKDFDLEFYLNFGDMDRDGADGMCFVLQTVGNRAIGKSGSGMGFEGFSPSLGIEFDTWHNTNLLDIAKDHIAININGNAKHNGPNSIERPVTALPRGGNIEDGEDHLVRIVWEQKENKLSVYFDCNLRISTTIDIQRDIFNNDKFVYWGFTGATGGFFNRQIACLRDDILVADTIKVCKGDTILLNAKESLDSTYVWSPSIGLLDATVRNPQCFTEVSMDYEVRYLDLCGNLRIDSIHVEVDEPFMIDDGKDTVLCDNEAYYFDLRNKYDSIRWGGIGIGTSDTVRWKDNGVYTLRAWKGLCYDDNEFEIFRTISPKIVITNDSLFCKGDSVKVQLELTPADVSWRWHDGNTLDTIRYFTASVYGFVEAENNCDDIRAEFKLTQIDIEDLTLGIDTVLCEDSSLFIIHYS